MLHRAGAHAIAGVGGPRGMEGICELLDHGDAARPYAAALRAQREKVSDVERTPSARMLRELRSTGESFYELALRVSRLHKEYFLELHAPNDGRLAEFSEEARESLRKQAAIEAAQTGEPIESYLKRFFATAPAEPGAAPTGAAPATPQPAVRRRSHRHRNWIRCWPVAGHCSP
jgi:hypothetical protein